jgi:hypothetical protein
MAERQWNKESAQSELKLLLELAAELNGSLPWSEPHTAWLLRARTFLSEVFGEDSTYFTNFASVGWNFAGGAVIGGPARPEESWDPQLGIERLKKEHFSQALGTARGVLRAAAEALDTTDDLETVYKSKDTGPEASLLIKAINLAEHKLRKALHSAPSSEKDVQDAFETLLIGSDLPYSRESKSIEYSSKTYKPDFTIDKADLAIELKICLEAAREKVLIAEINDDILAYGQEYGNQLFVIYDTGHIRDMDRFSSHFEEQSGVVVKVVKH